MYFSSPTRPTRRASAFTLIEIMLVVLIIGILVGIALPNFSRAREQARQKSCVMNLRQIDEAKEQWAIDNKKVAGNSVAMSDILGTYMSPNQSGGVVELRCPSSGLSYASDIGAVGQFPQCPTETARTGYYAHSLR